MDTTEPTLTRMIYFLARDMRTLAERFLSPYDLTLEQYQTLKALSSFNGVPQRQLGQTMNKTPGNMTRILDRLGAKSLLTRQTDVNDRRVCLVFLTPKGQMLVTEVKEVFERFRTQVYTGMTREMEQTARQAVAIMAANVETLGQDIKDN